MKSNRFTFLLTLALSTTLFADLQSDVSRIVAKTELFNGRAGVCVIDTATNTTLVELQARDGMIPASNQKILTSCAALHILGPEFKFQTRLLRSGDDLILVGDGDPTFGDMELSGITDWSTEREQLAEEIAPWADAVKSGGLLHVQTLWVDDRIFDRNFIHPSWPSDQINNWYCAQVSGLNYHVNVFHFFPSPIRGGNASLGKYTPAMPWLSIKNRTTSKTSKKDKSSFWVARSPNSNNITARGNVNAKHTVPVKVAFHDPAVVLGETLAVALRARGIAVDSVKRVSEEAPPSTGELIFLRETPIQYALLRSNRDSHNLYAESLLKRLSAEATTRSGTFDEGADNVTKVIAERLGSSQRGLSPSDGSGMSRQNSVSPRTIARLLGSFSIDTPEGKSLLYSLATPGNGTLKSRFKSFEYEGATVYAKSGYIREVSALSGFVVFDDKRAPLVFSIIANGVKGTVHHAKKMQEQIVALITEHTLQ